MIESESWATKLLCPKCKRTGDANGEQTGSLESLSSAFSAVKDGTRYNFFCRQCNLKIA